MNQATAIAHANIALVKYWGKRDQALNLPARGSLSMTLQELSTTVTVELDEALRSDELHVLRQGEREPRVLPATGDDRVHRFLDIIRDRVGESRFARVLTRTNFPVASGLASSSAVFAALALAGSRAFGLELAPRDLSALARRGSGSAARSIFPGLVVMHAGDADEDAYAEPLDGPWSSSESPLRMVVAIVAGGARKSSSSRDAMVHCAATSPLYEGWLSTVDADIAAARAAIDARDFDELGAVVEASALAMHASMWAARPAIRYWRPETLALIEAVVELRAQGASAYFTIDAGPHVKVLCLADSTEAVSRRLRSIAGVDEVLVSRPGLGARPT